jgi:hypothetical protein
MKSMSHREIVSLRDQHEPWLRAQPGVVGTAVGMDRTGKICLKIFSDHLSPDTRNAILERLGDIPVAIEETGLIRKQ